MSRDITLPNCISCIIEHLIWDLAEEPPTPFLPFHERPGLCPTWAIPMVPILQIHTQTPPIQMSSLGYQLGHFSKYSHIEKYRTQDHGAGGRPIGSFTKIHTTIPAITNNA